MRTDGRGEDWVRVFGRARTILHNYNIRNFLHLNIIKMIK